MKKKIFLIIGILLFSFLSIKDTSWSISYPEEKPVVILFYSPHCKACIKLKSEFLPLIKEKYKNKVEWKELSIIDNEKNLALLYSVAARFNRKAAVPSILIGDIYLKGTKEIEDNLERIITEVLKKESKPFSLFHIDLIQIFNKISIFTIMGSGLIDGINPCAFAVIVFFISFLAVYGYRKREVFIVGLFYCLAVFTTYLLLGLGFFKFIYAFSRIYLLIQAFYYFIAIFCFLLSGLALYDYFKFKKTKETEDLILQLPKFLKKKINITIGSRLRERKEKGILGLIISSLSIGFLVSILEAVCTGQVYVPTIVFIMKNTNLRLKAFTYLILYNLMFILPLILIFLLSLVGFTSQKFNNFLKKNLGKVKITMAVLFFVLGIFILWIS
jgi:cytochrome c biogenesis protein CcdA